MATILPFKPKSSAYVWCCSACGGHAFELPTDPAEDVTCLGCGGRALGLTVCGPDKDEEDKPNE